MGNVTMTPQHVEVYERLEKARMNLSRFTSVNKSALPLADRAALEMAMELANIECSAARVEWDKLVRAAWNDHGDDEQRAARGS
jgi:hypothetical protein